MFLIQLSVNQRDSIKKYLFSPQISVPLDIIKFIKIKNIGLSWFKQKY